MAGFGGAVKLTGESEYRAALAKITQNLKEVASEMKLVSSQYDKGDKSEAALSKQTEVLNKALAEQKKKFDTIKAAYDKFEPQVQKMKDEHADLVKEYDKEKQKLADLGVELGKDSKEYKDQAKVVEDLSKKVDDSAAANDANEKSLSQMRIEMNKAQTEVNKTARKIDELGKEEDDTTKDTKELGESIKESGNAAEKSEGGFTVMKGALASLVADGFRLAIDAAKKLTTVVINAGQAADELNTTSKQSGFSTEMLQKFNYAAELIDVDTETIISAARKMKKNMTSENADTVEAFEKLGVSVRDSNGELRDSEAVFFEVVEGLSRISNETDRDTTAMKLFGKGADELAGIIDDGGEAFRKYGKEAEDLGLILGQDTLDAANDFNDSIDKIKSTAKGAFSAVGSEIAKELIPFVERAQKKMQSFVKSEDFQDFKKKAVDAIGTVFKTIYNLFIFVKDNWRPIVTALSAIAAGLVAFKIASVIAAVVTSIHGFITSIKAAEGAMALFNSTAALSPFALIAAGIAAVVVGLIAFTSSAKDAKTATEKYIEAQDVFINKGKEVTDSIRDSIDASAEQAAAQVANVDYVEKTVLPQLEDLIDANGEVRKGEEERAAFLLGQFNEAMGTEYDSIKDIVDENGKLKDSIYDVIEARKADIYLSAYKDEFEAALGAQNDLNDAYAASALKVAELEREYDKALTATAEKYGLTAGQIKEYLDDESAWYSETGIGLDKMAMNVRLAMGEVNRGLKAAREEFDATEANVQSNTRLIETYNGALAAAAKGDSEAVIAALENYSGAFITAKSVMQKTTEEQQSILKEQVIRTQVAYRSLVETNLRSWNQMTDDQKKSAIDQQNLARQRATEALAEFEKVGGNMTKGTARGVTGSTYVLDAATEATVRSAVEAATGVARSAQGTGEMMANGLIFGFETKAADLVQTAKNMVSAAVNGMKNILQIHSPSKVTEELGEYFGEGFAIGIDESAREAQNVAKELSQSTVNALRSPKIKSSKAARGENMVDAFKEALAEMKIELDDRVAGKFVERTVARAIY